jgi:hypothetical protein
MSTSIDQAFTRQYETEVHMAYQRKGSKLRNMVRSVTNVKGSSTTFQKVGKGTADTKTIHGKVPVMNLAHSTVEVPIIDYYAGDWNDKMLEMKINHDERAVIANSSAAALGRKTDELIINALDAVTASGQIIAEANTGMTFTKALRAVEIHGSNDVFEEGEMWSIVGWKQWTELLDINEFANADYVGMEDLPFKAQMAQRPKFWMGAYWLPHSGLPVTSDIRRCYMFHKNSIGHAAHGEVKTDITWHGDRASWFINNMMGQGAGLIDELGVVEIQCDETPD